jgi:pilus assembly protein CpaE
MPELAAVVISRDSEQRSILQLLVEGTRVARTLQTFSSLPVAAADPVLQRIRESRPDVILLDIPAADSASGLRAIELLHEEIPLTPVVAVGSMTQPQVIVAAMRSGAREFLERPATTTSLLEALVRLSARQRTAQRDGVRGRIFSVVNAKGGSGATTVAVNLASALQSAHGQTLLADFAPLGHAALHLNLRPAFNVYDAIRNLHRLDNSLMESFTTRHEGGLQLLAGTTTPAETQPSTAEFARLLDQLATYFRFVVVDLSSRLDAATRLVCSLSQCVLVISGTDVASLWSAARVQQFLSESGNRERLRLVLNRFRKLPGMNEAEIESAAGLTLLWKIPNHYASVAGAIDRGVPVASHDRSELSRSFAGLAARLVEPEPSKRPMWSLFKIG